MRDAFKEEEDVRVAIESVAEQPIHAGLDGIYERQHSEHDRNGRRGVIFRGIGVRDAGVDRGAEGDVQGHRHGQDGR